MDKRTLLSRYEIRGDEADYLAAKPLYEQSLAQAADPQVLHEYGYLLECHARNEMRRAVTQYRRAAELGPDDDQVRYQLIAALGALHDGEEMVDLYRQRVAAAPDDLREYRFLASAHIAAGAPVQAREAIDDGLRLAPEDAVLLALRGDVAAKSGQVDAALTDWRRAIELDTSSIGPLFSIAFLLERVGRLEEAADTWGSIIAWCEAHGDELDAEFPRRELDRLLARSR